MVWDRVFLLREIWVYQLLIRLGGQMLRIGTCLCGMHSS